MSHLRQTLYVHVAKLVERVLDCVAMGEELDSGYNAPEINRGFFGR